MRNLRPTSQRNKLNSRAAIRIKMQRIEEVNRSALFQTNIVIRILRINKINVEVAILISTMMKTPMNRIAAKVVFTPSGESLTLKESR